MKIVLLDDHAMLTESVKELLLQQSFVEEVKTYQNAAKFIDEASTLCPDIVICDLMMPDINGIKLLEMFQSSYKEKIKFIILSSIIDVQIIKQAIRKGASGFLSKASSIDELIEAILNVKDGNQYISQNLRESLVNTLFTEEQFVYHLSPREKDVLKRVCSGRTIKEIAYELNLSPHTAQYYHRCVMNKLKVKRTSDLIVFAIQHGLYIPDVDQKKIL